MSTSDSDRTDHASIDTNGGVPIDVARLIVTRLLVEASSGGGKSWLLRRLLEQTHGAAQQIVIDYDGEFHTLREKFDYVLVGPGGDCPADVRSAAMLARKLLELGASAVIDISDLGVKRALYVKYFVEQLMIAPRDLWHDVLVVIDECHKLAPEKGAGEAVSTEAIKDLATRGRKRGFALVAATQRVSELHKTVIAECSNKLIGRTSLDLDIDRARSMLGMSKADAYRDLPKLEDGHFYAFGPALSKQVTLVKVGPVVTTHPTAGQRSLPPTPPRVRVKQILSQLANLPEEAEEEARTVDQLKEQLAKARVDLAQLDRATGQVDAEKFSQLRSDYAALQDTNGILRAKLDARNKSLQAIGHGIEAARAAIDAIGVDEPFEQTPLKTWDPATNGVTKELAPPPGPPMVRRMGSFGVEVVRADGIEMSKMERAILICLAQRGAPLSRKQILTLTTYRNSGNVGLAFARMIREGWIANVGSDVKITSDGVKALGGFEPLPTGWRLREGLLAGSIGKLDVMDRKILKTICDAYPKPITRKAVLEATSYANSGNIGMSFGKLVTLGYIDKAGGGTVVMSRELV